MIGSLRNFAKTKLAGVLVFIIIIPFVFWGMGSMFNSGNTNNIAKINKTNVSTQDFIDYLNSSGVSRKTLQERMNQGVIEELLSTLVSTTLLDLEINDFDIIVSEKTLTRKIKNNKTFLDENGSFQRTEYEKFLLTNNMTAPGFEVALRDREKQKHLFDYIGAGTITPKFLIDKNFKEQNNKLTVKFFPLKTLYRTEAEVTKEEIENFVEENKDQLKKEYIDYRYAELNPKILIGLEEFNQDFFDEIDKIEDKISNGDDFQSIIKNIKTDIKKINKFSPSSTKRVNEDLIYSKRSTKIDLIESVDSFLLYSITKKYDLNPDITNQDTKNEIIELAYQKEKFDLNRSVLEEIQNKKFDDNKFKEMAGNNKEYSIISSIEDDNKFEASSVKMLYSLPINSYTLVSDEDDKIYLVKLLNSKKNTFSETDKNYLSYVSKENTNTRKSIIQSYDQLLNSKYQVQLNQKTIDRVKNYFK